jgi:hypothetical protein
LATLPHVALDRHAISPFRSIRPEEFVLQKCKNPANVYLRKSAPQAFHMGNVSLIWTACDSKESVEQAETAIANRSLAGSTGRDRHLCLSEFYIQIKKPLDT